MYKFLWLTLLLLGGVCGDIIITTADELIEFSSNVNKGIDFDGTTVLLDSDIDLFGKKYEAAGKNYSINFLGTFDGQGHTISNLIINSTLSYTGLFGHSEGGYIRNVVMDSSCSFTSYGGSFVGSIIGYINSDVYFAKVENCVNLGRIVYYGDSGKSRIIGGIIGYLYPETTDIPTKNCANYGTITCYGTSSDDYSIGGIVGRSYLGTPSNIENCLNYGTITYNGEKPTELFIGGLIGYTRSTVIKNSVNIGRIDSSVTNISIGAIVGFIHFSVTITHCFWTSNVGYDNFYGGNDTSFTYSQVNLISLNDTSLSDLNEYAEKNKLNGWVLNQNDSPISFQINNRIPFSISSQLILLPDPVEYNEARFSGWYKDKLFNERLTETTASGITNIFGLYGLLSTVTFDGNGGNPSNSYKLVSYNKKYGDLPTAERTGHSFIGWFTERNGGQEVKSETIYPIKNNKTLYAKWNINRYTLTFAFNNGADNEVRTLDYNETIAYPENVLKTGYTFSKWDKEIDRMPAENITITALWTANKYTVTFDVNGGNALSEEPKEVTYDSTYGNLPEASRTGYGLIGWFTEEDGGDKIEATTDVKIAEDQTLYAHWSINQYTITFEVNGGSACKEIKQDYNTAVELPKPTKTGYTFAYWCSDIGLATEYTETTMPAEDKTLYAKWNINQYTLTFVFNNGAEDEVRTLDYNEEIDYPEGVLKTGHTFNEWENKQDRMPADNITITAQWTANKYTVTFDVNEGNTLSESESKKKVTYDSTYGELPEASRTGYTFSGWFTEKVEGTNTTAKDVVKITANQTLYAHWVANVYTVTFEGNGGTLSKESIVVTYDSTYGDLPEPSRTGYGFGGWYNEGGEEVTSETTFTITQDQTLYAHWLINNYTVTFIINDGTEVNVVFPFNSTITYPEPITGEGFVFAGWLPNPERMGAEDLTIRAQWNITKPSEYVEIVFSRKDLNEEEAKKIIKSYVPEGEEFTIEKFDTDGSGEIKVIIKFTDQKEAENFITTVSASSNAKTVIKKVGFIKEFGSFSPSLGLLTLAYYLI